MQTNGPKPSPPLSERFFLFSERGLPIVRHLRGYLEARHPHLLGRLDHLIKGRNWYPLGGPMNNQAARADLMRQVARRITFARVIETGTYLGGTTGFLSAVFGVPVSSVEVRARFWAFAVQRYDGFSGVDLHLGDSRAFLDSLTPTSAPTFFYLDAHRRSVELPLWEEVSSILARWEDLMIVIDDFEVPGDAGYQFDDYGPGMRLCVDDLRAAVKEDCDVMFPSTPSSEETGWQRGCIVIVKPGAGQVLEGLPLTKPVPLHG